MHENILSRPNTTCVLNTPDGMTIAKGLFSYSAAAVKAATISGSGLYTDSGDLSCIDILHGLKAEDSRIRLYID
jgi:hypothetical protein